MLDYFLFLTFIKGLVLQNLVIYLFNYNLKIKYLWLQLISLTIISFFLSLDTACQLLTLPDIKLYRNINTNVY